MRISITKLLIVLISNIWDIHQKYGMDASIGTSISTSTAYEDCQLPYMFDIDVGAIMN